MPGKVMIMEVLDILDKIKVTPIDKYTVEIDRKDLLRAKREIVKLKNK